MTLNTAFHQSSKSTWELFIRLFGLIWFDLFRFLDPPKKKEREKESTIGFVIQPSSHFPSRKPWEGKMKFFEESEKGGWRRKKNKEIHLCQSW